MKKFSYLIFITLFLTCCNRSIAPVSGDESITSNVFTELIDGLLEEFGSRGYMHDIAPKDITVALCFSRSSDFMEIFGADSCLFVSFYGDMFYAEEAEYIGIIETNSVILAIFDKNEIGKSFYDHSKIDHKPIDSLKKMDIPASAFVYRIYGDELKLCNGR